MRVPPRTDQLMSVGMVSDAQGTIVAPGVRDLDELGVVLADWLGARLPGATDVRLTGLTYPRGAGQSHETILFDAHWREGGVTRTEGLVARIKPSAFTVFQDDLFVEEYEIMRVLGARGGIPIARVRWFEEDPAVLGAPFFVMDKMAGRVAVSIPSYLEHGWVAEATTAQRARLWENCVRALAAVQSAPVAEVSFLDRAEVGSGFAQEWARWERYLEHVDRPDRPLPDYRELMEQLRATAPEHRPEGIVWGDARIGNMLIDDAFGVAALMDWEQPSTGGALHDLGWWLIAQRGKAAPLGGRLLPGMLSRDETIALWSEVTGIPATSIDWYEAFAAFKMACLTANLLDLRGHIPPGGDYAGLFHVVAARELLGS